MATANSRADIAAIVARIGIEREEAPFEPVRAHRGAHDTDDDATARSYAEVKDEESSEASEQ